MSDLISRQKAKDAIDMALDHIDHVPSWVYDNLLNALNEVPSVKPTHPTPSNTLGVLDCVDRAEAIKAVKFYETFCDPYPRVIESLEKLPSAQPETAKRIVGKSRGGVTLWYQCDMCNEPVDVQDNYCRGCGRRLING